MCHILFWTQILQIQILQLLNSFKEASDYRFRIIHEVSDWYDSHSSELNPYELHFLNAGTTYSEPDASINYPSERDWWQFTPPRSGSLNITFSSTANLNISIYDENRVKISFPIITNGTESTVSFGKINSTYILQVSLMHPDDLMARYNVTVVFVETYIPIVLSGNGNSGGSNSQSQLTHYLTELGLILVIGIVVMMVIQLWVKNRPKDILD